MVIIDNAAALEAVADLSLRPILSRYVDMMDLAIIYIIEPGDTLNVLTDRRGRSFVDWEFIVRHPGAIFEAVVIRSDDGAGDVILVPDRDGMDPNLLILCRNNAEGADDDTN